MKVLFLLCFLVPAGPAAAAQVDLIAGDQKRMTAEIAGIQPDGQMSFTAIDAERGAAEFMSVCVRPMWNMTKTAEAAMRSDLAYTEDSRSEKSGRWHGKRAYLALEEAPDPSLVGEGVPQCQLSLGSIQPRTSLQLTLLLKAALDAELGTNLQILRNDDQDSYIEWSTDGTDVMNRVTVEGEPNPARGITYLFERWSPHGIAYRKEMVRRFQESKKK